MSRAQTAVEAAVEIRWVVAHTRPRTEKKLADWCGKQGFEVTLPLFKGVKKYPGKTAIFEKPLFPNYLFLRLAPHQNRLVYQSDYVANLLEVHDQELFDRQLADILQALDSDLEIVLAPLIVAGSRVAIKSGPLRGLEGTVEQRAGRMMVHLRLDFISQAAAVKIDASDLESLD